MFNGVRFGESGRSTRRRIRIWQSSFSLAIHTDLARRSGSNLMLAPSRQGPAMNEQSTQTADQWPLSTTFETRRRYPAQATYRQLVARGFTSGEAANLTAYLNGIAIGGQPWAFHEVSNLLFLRELNRLGQFGPSDGAARQHLA